MIKKAVLDSSKKYRYILERQWGNDKNNFVNFILLNPSTADEIKDDRTIKACIKFGQNWGYDGIYVTNLFAFRTNRPSILKKELNPIGELNDKYLIEYAKKAKIIVFAWGNNGNFLDRDKKVINLLTNSKIYCLDTTKLGNPKHPLYVKRLTRISIFNGKIDMKCNI